MESEIEKTQEQAELAEIQAEAVRLYERLAGLARNGFAGTSNGKQYEAIMSAIAGYRGWLGINFGELVVSYDLPPVQF